MKKILFVIALCGLLSCAGWQPSSGTVSTVKTVTGLVKKLAPRTAVVCDTVPVDKVEKCVEVQSKVAATITMAAFLADKAIDLLAAGESVNAQMYALAALELLVEAQRLLDAWEVI